MKCPRDGSPLQEMRYEAHVDVDACTTCGGVWLDDGELEAIQESRERDHTKDLAGMPEMVGPVGVHGEPGKCPKCDKTMEAREYAHCSRISIDVCVEGHGVWVDGGELKALEGFFEKAKDEANAEDAGLWAMRSFWVSIKNLFGKKGSAAS